MQAVNRFGEPVYRAGLLQGSRALSFARMVAASPRRRSIPGGVPQARAWLVFPQSRRCSPWRRGFRTRKGVA